MANQTPLDVRVSYDALGRHLDDAFAAKAGRATLALLVVRIHNLRRINATFGHEVGRQILAELGERLHTVARAYDQVHLIGDDEYALILPDLTDGGHAELAASKVVRTVAEPFCINETLHKIAISIGIDTCRDGEIDPARLLQRAELALATAENRKLPYALYEDVTALATAVDWDVEAELADALESGALQMYYQPQLDIAGNYICGVEALMRWRHPTRGLLTPTLFIPAAERSGLIDQLTWAALNMTLQHAGEWPLMPSPLRVSVNLSATLLSNPELVTQVANAVRIWQLPPQQLVLEITETALVRDVDESYAMLKRLQDMRINISIDDFGTGYASFAYFRNLPVREIKIDLCFVSHMFDNEADRHIVESILTLAQKFHLHVVAEGVADGRTLDALGNMGCNAAQGYFIAEPMPLDAFCEFLKLHRKGWRRPA